MGRQPRNNSPALWHHVMNRGVDHQDIFECAGDGRHFLELIGESCARVDARIAASCLMTNHFHLLVNCSGSDLGSFMHHLGWNYARRFNRQRNRDGPIFRGRFRSLGIEEDDHLATVGRYIHRNPLDLPGPVKLDEYRWSSYRFYVTSTTPTPWLTTTELLAGQHPREYRHFVENDLAT